MKKIIIIGSGIGGSALGALISAETNNSVLLFEKNKIIGGRCASYKKMDPQGREWIFDIGCHIISSCDKGPLGEILQRSGKSLNWSYTKNPGPRVNIFGADLLAKRKRSGRKTRFTLDSSQKKENIVDLINNMPLQDTYNYDNVSINEFLNNNSHLSGTSNLLLYSIGTNVMFGTSPEHTAAGEFLRCMGHNNNKFSMGYPLGGTGVIPEKFCETIQENDGKVKVGKDGKVNKIIVEEGRVKGVEVGPDNEFFEADMVVSNSDIKSTVFDLIGEEFFSKDYLEYINGLKFGGQGCSLKLGIDIIITDQKMLTYLPQLESSPLKGVPLHRLDIKEYYFGLKKIPEKIPMLIVPITNHDPSLAPEGCQILHNVTVTNLDGTTEWSEKDDKKWEKTCMDTYLSLWPDLEDHIVVKDFMSSRKLGLDFGKEGAGVGIGQIVNQTGRNRPSVISPVKGLFFCSGDAGGWGIGTELPARAALELYSILKEKKFNINDIWS